MLPDPFSSNIEYDRVVIVDFGFEAGLSVVEAVRRVGREVTHCFGRVFTMNRSALLVDPQH